MVSFSQRKGIKPVRTEIQRESMDDDLRTELWNVLEKNYWSISAEFGYKNIPKSDDLFSLCENIWCNHLKLLLDDLYNFGDDISWDKFHKKIKEHFFKYEWNEVYDFIEFVVQNYQSDSVNEKFMKLCNEVLEKELSAYRFVDDKIVEITSKQEILEIESALQIPISPIQEHLNRALELFADKTNPDYRNSIKESISAVESLCKRITGNDKATLGDALKEIDKLKIGLHPALKKAFDSIYGYTSNADGIRHSLTDEPNLYSEDARFMLVTCSAFINYLSAKASKAGINLQ